MEFSSILKADHSKTEFWYVGNFISIQLNVSHKTQKPIYTDHRTSKGILNGFQTTFYTLKRWETDIVKVLKYFKSTAQSQEAHQFLKLANITKAVILRGLHIVQMARFG